MPRPKNKEELLNLGEENFNKLNELIDRSSEDDRLREFKPGTMNRNIRDVIAHLHHWHLMMMQWYEVGMKGSKPEMPAKGYTWKTTPALNKVIWEQYLNTELEEARKLFEQSYKKLRKIIESHSNEELFEKKRYKWTGSTSLGSYLVSATSSHYDWGYRLIRKGLI